MFLAFLIITFPFSLLSICLPSGLAICSEVLTSINIVIKEAIFISSMTIISPHEINIRSDSNITFFNLTLISPFLNFESPLIIIQNSELSSNASIALGLGHNRLNPQQGNAYAAIGAMCSRWGGFDDLTYGRNCLTVEQSLLEDRDRIRGSGGEKETEYGGGTIIIYAINALYLYNSIISSSGAPSPTLPSLCTPSSDSKIPSIFGGSGGLILLQSPRFQPFLPTTFQNSTTAETHKNKLIVEGGGYCGNGQGGGGSGGRINIVSNNRSEEIEKLFEFETKGGGSLDGNWEPCYNGGNGAVCLHTINDELGREEKMLKVDGKGFKTGTPTIISLEDSAEIESVIVKNMGYLSINLTLEKNKIINLRNLFLFNSLFEDFVVQMKDDTPIAISVENITTQNS